MTPEIVAFGEPLFELNQQPDGRYLPGFGGDTSNVAIAAARLGAPVSYVSQIGDDAPGAALLELWRAEQVDTRGIRTVPGAPTGLYLVTHGPGGHQFSYYRQNSAASRMRPADFPASVLDGARYLHFSAISQAISPQARETAAHAARLAAARGVLLSYDTNLRLKLWPLEEARAAINETAAASHLLKTSIDDARQVTGLSSPEDISRHFRQLGSVQVIVTLGSEGVHLATPEGHLTIAGRRVKTIDATGAGDAFTGALLAELCRGQPLARAAVFANAAAALSTQGYGAVAPLPRRAEVEAIVAAS